MNDSTKYYKKRGVVSKNHLTILIGKKLTTVFF